MDQEIIALDELIQTLRLWWLIAITVIIGGAFGFAFRYITPPDYESKATFHVSVDFTNSELNQNKEAPARMYDEDQAMQAMQVAFMQAIPQVIQYAQSLNVPMDETSFSDNSTIERMLALWDIRFRYKDALVAQKIVNDWTQQSLAILKLKRLDGSLKPFLSYELVSGASMPLKPTYYQTNVLVVAGSLIGLVVGIALTNLPIVKSRF